MIQYYHHMMNNRTGCETVRWHLAFIRGNAFVDLYASQHWPNGQINMRHVPTWVKSDGRKLVGLANGFSVVQEAAKPLETTGWLQQYNRLAAQRCRKNWGIHDWLNWSPATIVFDNPCVATTSQPPKTTWHHFSACLQPSFSSIRGK